jgi:adenosine deaminase CECR1
MDSDSGSWEAEAGVPHHEDPFIQRFVAGRLSLIQREKSQRHGENRVLCVRP